MATLLIWENLINECQRLEDEARKIQNNDYVGEARPGLSPEKVREFINNYLSWYGECLFVLPESLEGKFRLEYDGTELFPKIKSFLEAPLDSNPHYASDLVDVFTSGVGSFPNLWLRPYETTFRIPLFAQKQILYEARQHQPRLSIPSISYEAVSKIELLAQRFGLVARALEQRRKGDEPLKIKNEYDVQYLFKGLLKLFFEDVRPEEWTPSYAGVSTRADFLIKSEQIVVELKMTRVGLKTTDQVGEELIIDIHHYINHPDCKTLVAFVYDPSRYLAEPKTLENDLSQTYNNMPVKVIVSQG